MCLIFEQVICMVACWVEDPSGEPFQRHLARISDYVWIAEDGMRITGIGSQIWDAALSIQALIACNLIEEMGPTLKKGYDFLKNSQVSLIYLYIRINTPPNLSPSSLQSRTFCSFGCLFFVFCFFLSFW
uniref:Uncharacterized protein MANES_09G030600 n=1 Tax=Rhizophora mucronata TaxID=61149 RepID=A0A2P2MRU7_RHIMU